MIQVRPNFNLPGLALPTYLKVTVISVGIGLSFVGIISRMLVRRKRKRKPTVKSHLLVNPRNAMPWKNYNGDLAQASKNSPTPSFHRRQGSVTSEHLSTASTLTLNFPPNKSSVQLTPQQLGVMGMEALEAALNYWEDALKVYTSSSDPNAPAALTDAQEGNFTHLLQKILDKGYHLQDLCSQLFLYESSVIFRCDSTTSFRQEKDSERKHPSATISSADSFVSAQAEIANIHDFDEFFLDSADIPLYKNALKQLETEAVPYRLARRRNSTIIPSDISFCQKRAELLRCQSEADFLAKLSCVRRAFDIVFENTSNKEWFTDVGKQILKDLLTLANKDPKDCLEAYDELINFSSDPKNWPLIVDELDGRGLNSFTFYDIVLDFIVLDAFEDLENPPAPVIAVMQNRWLTLGFKESALATAVWSVLKTKRKLLKHPKGFISHFYSVTQYLSPVLAWGFLGPNQELKDICVYFKEEVVGFISDLFDVNTVRYTTLQDLAADIMTVAQERYQRTCARLQSSWPSISSNAPSP